MTTQEPEQHLNMSGRNPNPAKTVPANSASAKRRQPRPRLRSDGMDVGSLGTFRALSRTELDPLTFVK
jgi:hypothetical protein